MLNLPKGVSYIFIAVVAGLLATIGIRSYVARKTYVAPIATGQVVVATAEVSPGNALNGAALKVATWPKELIPPQAASALNQVDGRVVISPISSGEPILLSKLAPVGTAAGLSSLMEENKRAFTIRVDDVSGVAGFLHPGDKVDVLADVKVKGLDENFSKTILQNIKVLSTGQIWEQKGADAKPTVVNTVTLELNPHQSEVMNLASNEGKIRLVLRGRRNDTIVETEGVAMSTLFGVAKKEDPTPVAAEKEVKKEERTVEVIKGMERSKNNL
ncbi:MAG: Flp pilus assembly protein CpaB [Deltaproteobacteria bacterium]|nr:Flp pilus assembly protein CpaB [Deltaproteobacteria bacterium]